ncbi:MAG: hypothetical protein H8E42_00480, partial [Nitrospinae bacterium]|nr:hypothetical protein [Nitrospinota bacterium]
LTGTTITTILPPCKHTRGKSKCYGSILHHAVPKNDEISFNVTLNLKKHAGPGSAVTGYTYQVNRRYQE